MRSAGEAREESAKVDPKAEAEACRSLPKPAEAPRYPGNRLP